MIVGGTRVASVRAQFRKLRAAHWHEDHAPLIQIIFRAPSWDWRSPYGPAIPLYSFTDYDKLITAAITGDDRLLETAEMRVRRDRTHLLDLAR